MNTEDNTVNRVHDDIEAEAADIAAAVRNLKPNRQHRKSEILALLRPTIREMLDRKVSQKAILNMLAEKGLKLHPARFKELMAAEDVTKPEGHVSIEEAMQ